MHVFAKAPSSGAVRRADPSTVAPRTAVTSSAIARAMRAVGASTAPMAHAIESTRRRLAWCRTREGSAARDMLSVNSAMVRVVGSTSAGRARRLLLREDLARDPERFYPRGDARVHGD